MRPENNFPGSIGWSSVYQKFHPRVPNEVTD
jgi:hypothetical protein